MRIMLPLEIFNGYRNSFKKIAQLLYTKRMYPYKNKSYSTL